MIAGMSMSIPDYIRLGRRSMVGCLGRGTRMTRIDEGMNEIRLEQGTCLLDFLPFLVNTYDLTS